MNFIKHGRNIRHKIEVKKNKKQKILMFAVWGLRGRNQAIDLTFIALSQEMAPLTYHNSVFETKTLSKYISIMVFTF